MSETDHFEKRIADLKSELYRIKRLIDESRSLLLGLDHVWEHRGKEDCERCDKFWIKRKHFISKSQP